ncbi:MAG: hypothetical protein MK169_03780 [Candidatus Thalassarchaeum sp.]|nr:hypothetical protein [Candidatus Thalassarchaeum sp.]
MERVPLILAGAANGAILATLMILLLIIPDDIVFGTFPVAMLSFLIIILIPPFLIKKICTERFNVNPSLKHLIPVSFLTFFLPILGPAFGGPSLNVISYWLSLIVAAALGGAIWSIPFVMLKKNNQ